MWPPQASTTVLLEALPPTEKLIMRVLEHWPVPDSTSGPYCMLVIIVLAGPQSFIKRPVSNPLIGFGAVPSEVAQFFSSGSGMASFDVGVSGMHSKASEPVSTSKHGLFLLACSVLPVAEVVSVASNEPR